MPFARGAGLVVAAVVAGLTLTACGDDTTSNAAPTPTAAKVTPLAAPAGLVVKDAWARATTGSQDPSMTGVFMTLQNTGSSAVTLVRVSSAVARMTQLHEMTMVAGKAAMHEVAGGIAVAAGASQVLKPGGYHVMLMKLARPLAAGDEVPLTLAFSDGTTRTLIVPVKAFAEETGGYSPTPAAMH